MMKAIENDHYAEAIKELLYNKEGKPQNILLKLEEELEKWLIGLRKQTQNG